MLVTPRSFLAKKEVSARTDWPPIMRVSLAIFISIVTMLQLCFGSVPPAPLLMVQDVLGHDSRAGSEVQDPQG